MQERHEEQALVLVDDNVLAALGEHQQAFVVLQQVNCQLFAAQVVAGINEQRRSVQGEISFAGHGATAIAQVSEHGRAVSRRIAYFRTAEVPDCLGIRPGIQGHPGVMKPHLFIRHDLGFLRKQRERDQQD